MRNSANSLRYLSVIIPLFLVFLHVSASWAASDSVYDTFVQCLSNQTNQPDQITKIVYSQTNPSYTTVLRAYIRNSRFNTSTTRKPSIIITPTQESHVQAAVICSKNIGIQLKIRSGGHDYEGVSYISDVPFIILDMFNLRSVTINLQDQTAWVESGATLGELYYRLKISVGSISDLFLLLFVTFITFEK